MAGKQSYKRCGDTSRKKGRAEHVCVGTCMSVREVRKVTHQAVTTSYMGRAEGGEEGKQQQQDDRLCALASTNFSHSKRTWNPVVTPALCATLQSTKCCYLIEPSLASILGIRKGGSQMWNEQPQATGLSSNLAQSRAVPTIPQWLRGQRTPCPSENYDPTVLQAVWKEAEWTISGSHVNSNYLRSL